MSTQDFSLGTFGVVVRGGWGGAKNRLPVGGVFLRLRAVVYRPTRSKKLAPRTLNRFRKARNPTVRMGGVEDEGRPKGSECDSNEDLEQAGL
jgi:hypothetical protein